MYIVLSVSQSLDYYYSCYYYYYYCDNVLVIPSFTLCSVIGFSKEIFIFVINNVRSGSGSYKTSEQVQYPSCYNTPYH